MINLRENGHQESLWKVKVSLPSFLPCSYFHNHSSTEKQTTNKENSSINKFLEETLEEDYAGEGTPPKEEPTGAQRTSFVPFDRDVTSREKEERLSMMEKENAFLKEKLEIAQRIIRERDDRIKLLEREVASWKRESIGQ